MLGRRRSRSVASSLAARGFASDRLLDRIAYERLARRVDAASRKARGGDGVTLVSVTCSPRGELDPLAVVRVAAARGFDDACWLAHPQHDGHAIGGLGAAWTATALGEARFATVAQAMAERTAGMLADDPFDDPDAPAGSGVCWLGGFAFADEQPRANQWAGFDAANFVLPSICVAARTGGDRPGTRITVNRIVRPGDAVTEHLAAVDELVDAIAEAAGDRRDAAPTGELRIAAPAGPAHYENAVRRAVERIGTGEFEKLVLARELDVESTAPFDLDAIGTQLQERFPGCLSFVLRRGAKHYVGATPELLVRREGRRVSTMGLAGSARRGIDPAADDHLGRQLLASHKDREEHAIVVRRIERTLGRLSAWVAAGQEPELVKVKNIQHLATPIRAQLVEPRPVLELAGLLHPTPAVGGEPWPEAAAAIRELEGFDRGWYAGGVGWTDSLEDGELYVGLRCGLIEGGRAKLFAGAGIVSESDPASELAETETKFEALLAILAPRGDLL